MDNKYLFFKYYHQYPEYGKSLKPNMEGIVDEGCCYTNDISDFIMGLYSKEHISYEWKNKMVRTNSIKRRN